MAKSVLAISHKKLNKPMTLYKFPDWHPYGVSNNSSS
jgi:hypothetical protein